MVLPSSVASWPWCHVQLWLCFVCIGGHCGLAGPSPVSGWEVSQKSAKQTSTPHLFLGSFLIQWREINVFSLDFIIFWMSMLGWDESCSLLAGREWSMKGSDIGVYIVNIYILTNESKPILLHLPRFSAPSGNTLVGSLRVLPQGGSWHRDGRCPSYGQPRCALMERGTFLPIKTGQGAQKYPRGYSLPPAQGSKWHWRTVPDVLARRTLFQTQGLSFHHFGESFKLFPCKWKSCCGFHIESAYYSVIIFLFAWALLPTFPSVSFTPPT